MRRRSLGWLLLTLLTPLALRAQGSPLAPVHRDPSADAVFLRAQQLVRAGRGAAGRVLVDSVVASNAPDSPVYGDALYWRAMLAGDTTDAEQDLRRVIVEFPVSRHASDALLTLGQMEAARGERAAAAGHLDQFLLENPHSAGRARIGLQAVQLSFDLNDLPRGCATLGRVLGDVPADAVEMRNQLTYFSPRCAGVDTMRVVATTAAPNRETASEKGAAGKAPTGKSTTAAGATGKFTLQVAAYTSRADADALVKRLKKRDLDAHIDATAKIFRVRIGHYPTRAAAAAAAKLLKARKIDTFVTESSGSG